MKTLPLIILAWTAASGAAETFHSPRGFSFEVPDGWERLPAADMAEQYPSDAERETQCVYLGEGGIVVEAYWLPGRGMANDVARMVGFSERDRKELALAFEGGGLGEVRVAGHDRARRLVILMGRERLDGDDEPLLVFMAFHALRDGAVFLRATAQGQALQRPAFDRIVGSLTVAPGREYVDLELSEALAGLACLATGLLGIAGLCVAVGIPVFRRSGRSDAWAPQRCWGASSRASSSSTR